MIRIIGAILLVSGTAAWGFGAVMKLRGRVKVLMAFMTALEVMKSEICDRLTPLPELVRMLRAETAGPVSLFFGRVEDGLSELGNRSFSAIWRTALEDTPELLLSPQEKLTLAELGFSLGKYDTAQQSGALSYTLRRMETFVRRAEEERDKNSKMQAFLGVAAGVFAVIILL